MDCSNVFFSTGIVRHVHCELLRAPLLWSPPHVARGSWRWCLTQRRPCLVHQLRVLRHRPLEGFYQCPRQSTWMVRHDAAYRREQHTLPRLVVMSPPRVHTEDAMACTARYGPFPRFAIKTAHPTPSRKPRLTSLCLGTMHARSRQSGGPRHATGNIGTLRRAGSGAQTALRRMSAASRACPNHGPKPQQGATW